MLPLKFPAFTSFQFTNSLESLMLANRNREKDSYLPAYHLGFVKLQMDLQRQLLACKTN